MSQFAQYFNTVADLVPGQLDYIIRKHKRDLGHLSGVAKAFTFRHILSKGKIQIIVEPKRNTRKPLPENLVLLYTIEHQDILTGTLETMEKLAATLDVYAMTNKDRNEYLELDRNKQNDEFLNFLQVAELEKKNSKLKKAYKVDVKPYVNATTYLKTLAQDTVSSQVIRCTMFEKDGKTLLPHQDYKFQKVEDTPAYIYELYGVLSVAMKQACLKLTDEELYQVLKGFDREKSPYKTNYDFAKHKYTCCYLKCTYEGDRDKEVRDHYLASHWGREEWLKAISDYPLQQFMNSVVTAGDPDSVAKSVKNLCRDQRNLKCDEELLMLAVESAFTYIGFVPGCVVPPTFVELRETLSRGKFDMPGDASSGYVPVPPDKKHDPYGKIKFSNVTSKKLAKDTCIKLTLMLLDEIEEYIAGKELRDLRIEDIKAIIPISINMLMTKLETKVEGEELDKIRIFFIGGTLDYIIAKIYGEASFKEFSHGPGIGIGHKWFDGDGTRIVKTLERYDSIEYFDYSRFDSSLKGVLLCYTLMYLVRFATTEKLKRDLRLMAVFSLYMGDRAAAKIVEWIDGMWRLIFGYMMSGVFETSYGDSAVSTIIDFYNMLYWGVKLRKQKYVAEQLKKMYEAVINKDVELLKKLDFFFQSYGDNKLQGANGEMKDIVNLKNVEETARTQFDMTIKWKNAGKCARANNPYSHVDKFYNLIKRKWVAPDGSEHFIPHGIVYLKRWPIKQILLDGSVLIRCYRPTKDYLARLGRTPIDIRNPGLEFGRNVGNIHDMCQSNPLALDIVLAFNYALLEIAPWCENWMKRNMSALMQDPAFKKFFWKVQDRTSAHSLVYSLFNLNPHDMEQKYVAENTKLYRDGEAFEDNLKKRQPPMLSYRDTFRNEEYRWA